jgi:hypothetical protein
MFYGHLSPTSGLAREIQRGPRCSALPSTIVKQINEAAALCSK